MCIARWPWPEIIINCTVITAAAAPAAKQLKNVAKWYHKYENTVIQRNCGLLWFIFWFMAVHRWINAVHFQFTLVHFTDIQ